MSEVWGGDCIYCGPVDGDPYEHLRSDAHREMARLRLDLDAAFYVPYARKEGPAV